MDQIRIGRFIAQCRKAGGLTQRQLADELGISDKTVSKWEEENPDKIQHLLPRTIAEAEGESWHYGQRPAFGRAGRTGRLSKESGGKHDGTDPGKCGK